jgi:hypothetical protein
MWREIRLVCIGEKCAHAGDRHVRQCAVRTIVPVRQRALGRLAVDLPPWSRLLVRSDYLANHGLQQLFTMLCQ